MFIHLREHQALKWEGHPPLYPAQEKDFAMAKETRDEYVIIRMTKEEKAALKKKAEAVGGMSALLRMFAQDVRIRDRETERKRIIMWNRINANLNMIAKHCNFYKSASEAVEIISRLIAIGREAKRLGRAASNE